MTRHLLNLLTLLSLLLCVAVVAVWVGTYETQGYVRFRVPGVGRYTLYSQYGEVRVFGLPRPSPASQRLLPIARRISNDDAYWDVWYREREPSSPLTFYPGATKGTASYELLEQVRLRRAVHADLAYPLVEALEDPERFAAAHGLLSQIAQPRRRVSFELVAQTLRGDYAALPVELDLSRSEKVDQGRGQFMLRHRGPAVSIDPASHAAVRDQWHTTLHVPLKEVPYWPLAAAAALLPGARVLSALRRWRQGRIGMCRSCGYDLRATPDRCPECGATPVGKSVQAR